jgi:hypothetical protein
VWMRSEHKYRQRDHRARRNHGNRAPTHLANMAYPRPQCRSGRDAAGASSTVWVGIRLIGIALIRGLMNASDARTSYAPWRSVFQSCAFAHERGLFLSWKQGRPVMIFTWLEQGAMSDCVTCLDFADSSLFVGPLGCRGYFLNELAEFERVEVADRPIVEAPGCPMTDVVPLDRSASYIGVLDT